MYACMCIKSTCARRKVGLAPKQRMKNEWNKWKNHFYEMKGDVCRDVEFGSMALLVLRSSGFHGSPYAKELRVPWLSLC